MEADISYRKTAAGWLPSSWQITQRSQAQAKEKKTTTVAVKSIELNPEMKDSDFKIRIEPGMYVDERFEEYGSNARPKSVERYRLEANGEKTALDSRLAPK